jgi:hypothetical protein
MKTLISFLLILSFSLPVAFAQDSKVPDIIVDSKLDFDWTSFLVAKLRRLLTQNGLPDPFTMKIDEPLVVTDSIIESYLDPEAKQFVTDLGKLIGLDLVNGQTKVVIDGLDYDIKDFKSSLKRVDNKSFKDLTISADFSASKLNLRAETVTLSVLIPTADPSKKASIDIKIVRPVIRASVENLINFDARIKIQDNGDHFKFMIPEANFENMANVLLTNPKGIYMNFRDIIIPDIRLRVGNRTLRIDPLKVKELINNNQKSLKSLLMSLLASQLKKGMGTDILKVIERYSINKEHWFHSSLLTSYFKIDSFSSARERNNLEIKMPADFCAPTIFKEKDKACLHNKQTLPKASRITPSIHQRSMDEIQTMIDSGDVNLAASISEDYINKIIAAAYDSGMMDEQLKKAGVRVGPNGISVRLDNRGEYGTLYMDLLYSPKKLERLAIGAKEVRFPVIVKVYIRIQNVDDVPNLIIHFGEADLREKTLLEGIPELGVVSNLNKLRLKKKVIHEIQAEVAGMQRQDVLSLAYPEIKGLGLENVDFEADGHGRMNALLRLKDVENTDN